ncbi:unnamed protein product [Cochlearia groenlandica]
MFALIMIITTSLQTKANDKRNDQDNLALAPSTTALAPFSQKGLLPKPITCVIDIQRIPKCVTAVKHFHLQEVTRRCCAILLNLSDDCFGKVFPARFVIRIVLKATCTALGVKKPGVSKP